MVFSESDSKPLDRLTRTCSSRRTDFRTCITARMNFEGTARTRISAAAASLSRSAAGLQIFRQLDPGQEDPVFPLIVDGVSDLFFPDPDPDLLLLPRQVVGKSRPPGAAADDQYFIHFYEN